MNIQFNCSHRFSLDVLRDIWSTKENEEKYIKHFTGFTSIDKFTAVLNFIVPNGNRNNIMYWKSRAGKDRAIDIAKLFDSDRVSDSSDSDDDDDRLNRSSNRSHLSVEDEFLLVMMKLRMGLTNFDLAIRFSTSDATVSNILITWINLIKNRTQIADINILV